MAARDRRGLLVLFAAVALLAILLTVFLDRDSHPVEVGHDTPVPSPRVTAPGLEGGASAPEADRSVEGSAASEPQIFALDDFAIRGRVVERRDGRLFGVGGVHVRLFRSDAEPGAADLGRTTTSASGAFVLTAPWESVPVSALGLRSFGSLTAHAPDGRVARSPRAILRDQNATAFGRHRGMTVGDLELLAAQEVSVIVRGASPGQPVELHVQSNAAWETMPPCPPQRVVDELPHVLRLPSPGNWRIGTRSPGCARALAEIKLPLQEATPVVLNLVPERRVTIRVVDRESGAGIEGATVHATWWPPEPDLVTGADGTVRLPAQPDPGVDLLAHAVAPGYPIEIDDNGILVRTPIDAAATEATITLRAGHTLRWPISADSPHIPADGSRLELLGDPTPFGRAPAGEAHVEGREVVLEGAGLNQFVGFGAWAVTTDGFVAALRAPPSGRDLPAVTFDRPQTIRVHVRTPTGAPVAGVGVHLQAPSGRVAAGATPTDENGTVAFDRLLPTQAEGFLVYVGPRESTREGQLVGEVAAAPTDSDLEVILQPPVHVVADVTIDGVPGTPPGLQIRPGWGEGILVSPFRAVDGVEGRFEATWFGLPGTSRLALHAEAQGFPPADAETPVEEGTQRVVLPLALMRGGQLIVQAEPARSPGNVVVEQVDPASGTFRQLHDLPQLRRGISFSKTGRLELKDLPAGTYRLRSPELGLVSPRTRIEPGAVEEIKWKVAPLWSVTGHVELPPGVDPSRVFVVAELPKRDGQPTEVDPTARDMDRVLLGHRAARLGQGGFFRIALAGGAPVPLRVAGHGVRPADVAGEVVIEGSRIGVVLRAEAAPVSTLRLTRPVTQPTWGRSYSWVGIVWEHGAGDGPVQAILGPDRDTIEVSGLASGSGWLWIDPPHAAPIRLEGVVVREGQGTDLGVVNAGSGCRLLLRVVRGDRQVVHLIQATLERDGVTPYQRHAVFRETGLAEGPLVMDCLEGGPHRLTTHAATRSGATISRESREVVIPPQGDVEIVLDYSDR